MKYPKTTVVLTAILVAGLLSRQADQPTNRNPSRLPSVTPSQVSLPLGEEKPLTATPSPDIWTDRLVSAYTPDPSKINLETIHTFNTWARTFVSGTPISTDRSPRDLAAFRRIALKELIKQDPETAWIHMLPADIRAALPAEIQPYLEESIEQTGDWEVYAACFWHSEESSEDSPVHPERPSIFHKAIFDNRVYEAFPVGLLSQGHSSNTISLQGFSIDSTAVFKGVPQGRLEGGSPFPEGTALHTVDPSTGTTVFDEQDLVKNQVIPRDSFALGAETGIHFFESEASLQTYLASPTQRGDASGYDSGHLYLYAPENSITGEPDSLPLTNRSGGEPGGWQSLGYRTLLYMRIAFSNAPNVVVQSEAAAYFDLRTVNDHLLESSYGRMQILPTVTPVLILPQPQSYYASEGTSALATDARAAAVALGYTPGQYGHRVYRYNGSPGTFGGLAVVGGLPGEIWLRQNSAGILVHEIGHNYAFLHSNGWVTDSKAAIGPSSSLEYDHQYCVMGENFSLNQARFTTYQKSRIGWLQDDEYIDSQVSGRHRIYAMDVPTLDPDKRYAIRIPTPNRGNYWVEYRNNYTSSAFQNGLLLQAQGTGWGPTPVNPQRIDVTYWSKKNKDDSTIPVGWTFSDHEQGVHITPINRAGDLSWIDVQVHHEQDFTENSPPTATFTASTTTPAVGENVTFTLANLSDPDGDELKQYWYFDNEVYHNFSSANFTSRGYTWNTPGVYHVIAVVTDMKGGTCFRSLPVTVGSPSTFTISGQITDHDNNGVGGVPVDNGLGFSNENYRSTLTDEDGNYTLTRLPAGTYTVGARKNYDVFGVNGFTNPVTVGPSATGIGFRARKLEVTATGTPSEAGSTGQFVISRVKSPSTFNQEIDFRISMSGDAEEGSDYTLSPAPVNGVYSMLSGTDSFSLTLTPVDDGDAEGPEDATLSLGMMNNLSVINTLDTKATLLIEDNEDSSPRIRAIPMDRHMQENGGTARVLFLRYGDTTNSITVNIGTDAAAGLATYGDDYSFDTGSPTIVIPAGTRMAILTVTGIDDQILEGYEQLRFRLNTGTGYIRDRDPFNILIDMVDDDIPTVSVTAEDEFSGEGNKGLGSVRFTRSPVSASSLFIQYGVRGSALHGTDYSALTGVAFIPANETFVDVIIEGLPDALIEGSETAILRASTNNASDYILDASALEAMVNVNDKPILTLTGPASPFSELSPSSGVFTIHRVGPTDAVEVTLESTGVAEGGVDFTFPSTVSLPANTSSVTFQVNPLPDSLAEGDETISITINPQTEYGIDDSPVASQIIEDLPVDEWKFSTFGNDANTPSISGDSADPDEDQQANLYEFATLTNPLVIDTADLQPEADAASFSIEFTRRKSAGVMVQCVWSDSPDITATWSKTGITEQLLEDTPEYTRVRATLPVSDNVRFLKVEVLRTP